MVSIVGNGRQTRSTTKAGKKWGVQVKNLHKERVGTMQTLNRELDRKISFFSVSGLNKHKVIATTLPPGLWLKAEKAAIKAFLR